MDAGQWIPPLDDPQDSVPKRTIDTVGLVPDELARLGEVTKRVYWARYDSLLGDRWEARNSDDPSERPEVEQIRKVRLSPPPLWRRLWRSRPTWLGRAGNGPGN
jgi:hypothetical protein